MSLISLLFEESCYTSIYDENLLIVFWGNKLLTLLVVCIVALLTNEIGFNNVDFSWVEILY